MAFTKSFIAAVAAMAMSASLVSAVPVNHHDLAIRKAAPADWWSGWENYQVYHRRYNALGCKYQHETIFFRDCCGPLYKGTTLAVRPDMCDPKKHPYTATKTKTPSPAKTGSAGDEEDEDDDAEEYKAYKNTEVKDTKEDDKKEEKKEEEKPAKEESKDDDSDKDDDDNDNGGSGGEVNKGGFATFYDQNGNAGACGKVNPDGAMIGAIDHERWGKDSFGEISDLCGKKVHITNTKNGKSVTITIADVCPTCANGNSIDLSRGAFNKIATEDEGMVPITWSFA